jgi:hypothetical protein
LEPVTLFYQGSTNVGPFRRPGRDFLALQNGWEFALHATAGGDRTQPIYLGQDAAAEDGPDVKDIEMPPLLQTEPRLRLGVLRPDWGRESGAYYRDIQGPGQRELTWRVAAEVPAGQEVTLHWSVRSLPADTQVTLVDLQTGARRNLRSASSFTFNGGPTGGTRLFDVVATRGSQRTLNIPFMSTAPTRSRGVALTYTLSAPATVTVLVESPTGRRVRTVATAQAVEAGQNSIAWDGRDDEGRLVPPGQYRVRVLVASPDGQQAVAERMVLVGR